MVQRLSTFEVEYEPLEVFVYITPSAPSRCTCRPRLYTACMSSQKPVSLAKLCVIFDVTTNVPRSRRISTGPLLIRLQWPCESQCGWPQIANYFVLRQALLASSKCFSTIAEREQILHAPEDMSRKLCGQVKVCGARARVRLYNLWLCPDFGSEVFTRFTQSSLIVSSLWYVTLIEASRRRRHVTRLLGDFW